MRDADGGDGVRVGNDRNEILFNATTEGLYFCRTLPGVPGTPEVFSLHVPVVIPGSFCGGQGRDQGSPWKPPLSGFLLNDSRE